MCQKPLRGQFSIILTKQCWVLRFSQKPVSNADNLLIWVYFTLSLSLKDLWHVRQRALTGLQFPFSKPLSFLNTRLTFIDFKSLRKQPFLSERFITFVMVVRWTSTVKFNKATLISPARIGLDLCKCLFFFLLGLLLIL